MKNNRGLTLLEMMSTVLVIAVLSSVALPAYANRVKQSREAEGKFILAQIRAAELRYQANWGSFTNNLNRLDVSVTGSNFYYSLSGASASDFTATASMASGGNCSFSVGRSGMLTCTSGCVSCNWTDARTAVNGGASSSGGPGGGTQSATF